jgi:hypothetical protein
MIFGFRVSSFGFLTRTIHAGDEIDDVLSSDASTAGKRHCLKSLARIITLATIIALAACGGTEYSRSRAPADAVDSYAYREQETPGSLARLPLEIIRYTQATFSVSGSTADGVSTYTVEDNIKWLQDNPDKDLPWGGPIRVFRKQAFMDEWGPLTRNLFTGDPKNLENGMIYTLDHRRLVAYRGAGRQTIPVEWTNLRLVRDQRWRFTTTDRGQSIAGIP